jgi:uncharacterized membrane protein YccC
LDPVVLGHIVGTGLVIALNLVKPIWSRATRNSESQPESSGDHDAERPSIGFVVQFASIVSLSIVAGVAAGTRLLTSDPTLIANATLNIISPSLRQTWNAAVERVILGTLGIAIGFYMGWFFPQPWVGNLLSVVFAFLALGFIYVNFGLLVGAIFAIISYPWGRMHSDLGHMLANEKLIGEAIGVVVAVIAIAILTGLERRRKTSQE